MRFPKPSRLQLASTLALVSLLLLGARPLLFQVSADQMPNRYLQLASSLQGQNTRYKFGFDIVTAGTIGSIRFQFCDNTPLIGDPCNPPAGFDISTAAISSMSGVTGFTISGLTDANTMILTRAPALASAGPATYDFANVINPSAVGAYYVRVETFATTDATGLATDYGGIAYVINSAVDINATVPPFLLFCTGVTIAPYDCSTASGNYVNLGTLTSSTSKSGQTQMLIATNAGFGFAVVVNGTTMTSGTDVIPAITSNDVSRPGVSQFGINLVNNSSPNVGQNPQGPGAGAVTANYGIANRYRFNDGEQIARSTGTSDYKLFTISYLVNVSDTQGAGTYVSTLTYTCTSTF